MSENNENIIVEENTAEQAVAVESAPAETVAQPKKKSKAPVIALLCVLVLVAGVLAFAFGSGSGEYDPVFYTDEEAFYVKNVNALSKEPVKLLELESEDQYVSNILINTEGTEIVFEVSDFASEESFATVYGYSLSDPAAGVVKLAEKVNSVVKNEETGIITCVLGEDSRLVQFDAELKETEIAKEVDTFAVSPDGQKLLYTLKDGMICLKEGEKEVAELSKKGELTYYDAELSLFYIIEEKALYKVTADGEKKLIDEGVASATFSDVDGYYFKSIKTFLLTDLFEDDMLESDNEIKTPAQTGTEEYEIYSQKVIRENIRAMILDPETVFEIQDVYYYDGTQSKLVVENALEADAYNSDAGGENVFASIFCTVLDVDNMKKVRMSEIWKIAADAEDDIFGSIDDLMTLITDPFVNYSEDFFVYKGEFAAPTGIKGMVYDEVIDYTNKLLYLSISNGADEDANDILYKFPITENGLGEAEVICEQVSVYTVEVTEDGKLFYVEDIYPEEGEEVSLGGDIVSKVYFDSKLIAENVSNVFEKDLEKGIILMEKYKLKEDGTPDFEEFPYDAVFYSTQTGQETLLSSAEDEDTHYYSLAETPLGKTLLLKEEYSGDATLSKLYFVEEGTLKEQKDVVPTPEYVFLMSESLNGYGYTDWENEWEEMFDF